VNYQHLMPTRYQLDVDLKAVVTQDTLDNATKKVEARKVGFGVCVCACVFLRVCACMCERARVSVLVRVCLRA
jgi:hypothetical protein